MLYSSAKVRISFLVKPSILLLAICIVMAGALLPRSGGWGSNETARYACYFAIALMSASLRVRGRDGASGVSMSTCS